MTNAYFYLYTFLHSYHVKRYWFYVVREQSFRDAFHCLGIARRFRRHAGFSTSDYLIAKSPCIPVYILTPPAQVCLVRSFAVSSKMVISVAMETSTKPYSFPYSAINPTDFYMALLALLSR